MNHILYLSLEEISILCRCEMFSYLYRCIVIDERHKYQLYKEKDLRVIGIKIIGTVFLTKDIQHLSCVQGLVLALIAKKHSLPESI